MAKTLIFRGRKINLRRIRPNDLDNMCRLTNDKKVSYYLPMMPFPYGEADVARGEFSGSSLERCVRLWDFEEGVFEMSRIENRPALRARCRVVD